MKKYILTLIVTLLCVMTMKPVSVQAATPDFEEIPVYAVDDMTNYDQKVGLSWQLDWNLNEDAGIMTQKYYAKFTLKEDSIVRIKMATVDEKAFAAQDWFRLYGNATMATPLTDNTIEYGNGDDYFLLPAGTYYAECGSKLYESSGIVLSHESAHSTKIMIGAIAENKATVVTQIADSGANKVTVNLSQKFASELGKIEYCEGKVTSMPYNAQELNTDGKNCSFTVLKNGWYTVRTYAKSSVAFNKGLEYLVYVNVTGIKNPAQVGVIYKQGNLKYKVLKNNNNLTGNVSVAGIVRNTSSVTIPKTVKLMDYTYKVTKIESKAFYGKNKVKKVTVDSTSISSIGKNAFNKINKNATIYVPKTKYSSYNRMLKNSGVKRPVKVEKIKIPAEVGTIYTKNNVQYKVIKNSSNGTGTVYVMGMAKNKTSVTIPETVKLSDYTYKITKINSKAFYNNSKLRKVTIKAKTITSIGRNAFKGINKRAVVYVPKAKQKSYSSKLKSAGVKSPMKIKTR